MISLSCSLLLNRLVNLYFKGADPAVRSIHRQKEKSVKHSDYCHAKRTLFGDKAIDKSLPTEFLDTVLPSRPLPLPYDELSDVDVGFAMDKLQKQFHENTAGLQYPGLGQFVPSKSAPRFRKSSGLRFVQIINVGDHWICVTNVFGHTQRDVYIYDSLYSCVDKTRVVQVMLASC